MLMTDHQIALAALAMSVLGTLGSALGAALAIRWHCGRDDRRAGALEQQAADDRLRIEALERRPEAQR
jgi:hypothetical protein